MNGVALVTGTADPFAQAKQYLARVVPWPNAGEAPAYVNVVNSFQGQNDLAWAGRAVTSLDEAINYIQWAFGKQGTVGIYTCMSAQREPGEAKINTAGRTYYKAKRHSPSHFKSLWLDIDTKLTHADAEYKDLPEAAAALTAFWKTVGLPKPNIIVCTGGGLQPYWCMSRALTVDEWKPLAHALVEATKRQGLKCDTGCTTDSVRVLRVPGTENRKVNPPLKAKIVGTPVDGDYSVEDLWQSLEPYKVAAHVSTAPSFFEIPELFAAGPSKLFAGIKVTNDLGEGLEQHTLAPAKLDDVAAECPFVCEAINTGGGSYANPLWNLTTLLATFTEGGRADAHRMANKHPGYSKESTDALFDRKEREKAENGIGWPSCKAISGSGCRACEACPHLAAGKSPLHLGLKPLPRVVTTTAPVTVDYVPGNEAACRQELDRVVSDDPNTFVVGGVLVIFRIPSKTELPDNTDWAADFPGTSLATPADIMERAERLIWRRPAGGKGNARLVRVHPPAAFINNYLQQMRDRYGARPLRGIARTPVIAPSGDVQFPEGYDPQTGLFHDRTPIFELPDDPSHADAVASAQVLLEPFSEYKFEEGAAGAAVMLGAIFTSVERPFLGTAPMMVIRSSMPGTGKGLIVRCLVWLAYGTLPVLVTWGHSKEEFEKRLASILITSPAAFSIDNANGMQIEGELLESIITEGSADIRLLGRSEMVRVRNRSLVTLTGNNPSITGDMARRTLPIDIVPRSSDPERDRYPFNPFDVVQARRTEFLMHAFTIMRAYRLAGMPESGLPAVGSFDAWSRRVRDLVFWLSGHDISEVFRRNKAEDPRRQGDGSLLAALNGHFSTKSFKSAEPIAVYQRVLDARRPLSIVPSPTPTEQALADAIEDVFGGRGVNSKQFGYWARRVHGAHIDGFILDIQHDSSTNSNVCSVRRSP